MDVKLEKRIYRVSERTSGDEVLVGMDRSNEASFNLQKCF